MKRLAPLSSRLDGFFMEARRGTRARPERGRPSVKSEAGGGGISVSELGVTAALGAALWRYRNIKTSNTLLLETKIEEEELLDREEDFDSFEESGSVEMISSLFLTALSCFPYLNWLPWLFMMQKKLSSGETKQSSEGSALYYLLCAGLYASPYVDLFGTRDLATAIDGYVLVAGIVHLQIESLITSVTKDLQVSVEQQWSAYEEEQNES
mmetsp:Transcript_8647/g.16020  ORF Transcript_8647/g.16020 Transcript_8647/m.16020 type:complete len:210 (+) Transcript_8647:211-840(+)|eukprot:CAMPEP_0197472664 /NCGR_PEP_ID=MMETSP1309-20131121/3879_1 /TAXON_ID=464262 /ORGANISM="Genus nov. species nov., Strain RCC998" /LENGTH=209 /DNA_ID=CAMNT_0043011333 /DNA_START=219 /DNA_END=848 /DNA_ORIENTATION=-